MVSQSIDQFIHGARVSCTKQTQCAYIYVLFFIDPNLGFSCFNCRYVACPLLEQEFPQQADLAGAKYVVPLGIKPSTPCFWGRTANHNTMEAGWVWAHQTSGLWAYGLHHSATLFYILISDIHFTPPPTNQFNLLGFFGFFFCFFEDVGNWGYVILVGIQSGCLAKKVKWAEGYCCQSQFNAGPHQLTDSR